MLEPLHGSYRDPSGYIFGRDGAVFRYVAASYGQDYDALIGTGLYNELASAGLLIPHEECATTLAPAPGAYRVLRPQLVEFISYPFEWCFGQLKAAALCTLAVQRQAIAKGMTLKDASAYNVQFRGVQPVFIDTLSFERRIEARPWQAYRQFCEHFLVPLLLMARVDPGLGRLLRLHLDGIPLDLGTRLLGLHAYRSVGSLMHVVLHGRSVRRHVNAAAARVTESRISRNALEALVADLENCVLRCTWDPTGTEWAEYESTHGYTAGAHQAKRTIVADFLARLRPAIVWDLGANTGEYSRLAVATGARTIAFDLDPAAVERNFRRASAAGVGLLLPLVMDVADPTPACGWDLRERLSLFDRGPADAVLALALVHHLGIGRNIPFGMMAESFARLGRHLVIEFVPKDDPQTRRLLAARVDVFPHYGIDAFERAFTSKFTVLDRRPVEGTDRVLYLMARNA
jgi:hypothetical protein